MLVLLAVLAAIIWAEKHLNHAEIGPKRPKGDDSTKIKRACNTLVFFAGRWRGAVRDSRALALFDRAMLDACASRYCGV